MEKKLRNRDWDFFINKIDKKLDNWKGKLLSISERLTLIKVVLNAIPIYWMCIFRLPVNIRKRIDQLCRRFLWFGDSVRKKSYCLVVWRVVCNNYNQWGLGVIDLKIMNKTLLCKWLWKYNNSMNNGLWKDIIKIQYNNIKSLNNMSPF
jgi:hypothetical protein